MSYTFSFVLLLTLNRKVDKPSFHYIVHELVAHRHLWLLECPMRECMASGLKRFFLTYLLRLLKLLDNLSMIVLSAFVWDLCCCVQIFWRGLFVCFSNVESLIYARSHGHALMCL